MLLLLCHVAGTGPHRARYRPALPHTRPPCVSPCPQPRPHVPRFGSPLVLWAERGASWAQLQRDVLAPLRGMMRSAVQVGVPMGCPCGGPW